MNDKTKKESEKKEPEFEEALARLEVIVTEMESGDLTLEQSMVRFEEGMKLSKLCSDKLEKTEKRIEILMKKSEEGLLWEEVPTGNADADGNA